jgi:hypothetical protein
MHCRPLQRICYTESEMSLITVWMCSVTKSEHIEGLQLMHQKRRQAPLLTVYVVSVQSEKYIF